MPDIRCVCVKCGRPFVRTHEESMAALRAVKVPDDMFDTRKFKTKTDRMGRPRLCGGCRGTEKG